MKQRTSQTSAIYTLPDPGELNKRVMLRQRENIPAGDYGTAPDYRNQKLVWAKVGQVSATTLHESAQTDNKITHYFTIRFRNGITADFEIVYQRKIYAVRRGRDLNDARRFLLLECEELGAEHSGDNMYG